MGSLQVIAVSHNQQNVDMWQAMFLPLHNCQVSNMLAKQVPFDQVIHKLVLLLFEHSCHKVGSVLGCLTYAKVVLYLWPVGIAGHCDKVGGLLELLHNRHTVVVSSIIPSGTANQ